MEMRIRLARRLLRLGMLAGAMGVLAHGVHAQGVSLVRSGSFEVGPFVGATYGIDKFRFMGGGNLTFAINKYILPYVEYSYFPGIGTTVGGGTFAGSGLTFTVEKPQIPLSDIHGGVHIRIPIRESPVVPYLAIGFGALTHSGTTATASYVDASDGTTQQTVAVSGGTNFAANFGGGIRYYISQRFGMRVEAKGYKPSSKITGLFGQVPAFGKVEVGVFFQLR